jgi:DNA-binding NarL/FixJ family response regulator
MGYVMKKESTGEVIAALRKAFMGERHISEKIVASLVLKGLGRNAPGQNGSDSPVDILSDRELEVFEHLGRGSDTKSIAASMGVSPKTVETHRMHIKEKLQIPGLSELIQQAAVWVDRKTSGG